MKRAGLRPAQVRRNGMAKEPREGGRGRRDDREERDNEFVDRLVHINRVAKTVKGGRRMASPLSSCRRPEGPRRLRPRQGREVPEAIRKATESAKRGLIRVPLREGRTLHHDVRGRHGAGKVVLRAAPAGTGVIAGGPMRAIFESLGMQDVVAKSLGSSNPTQHGPRDLRRAGQRGRSARRRGPSRPQGLAAPGPSRRPTPTKPRDSDEREDDHGEE